MAFAKIVGKDRFDIEMEMNIRYIKKLSDKQLSQLCQAMLNEVKQRGIIKT